MRLPVKSLEWRALLPCEALWQDMAFVRWPVFSSLRPLHTAQG